MTVFFFDPSCPGDEFTYFSNCFSVSTENVRHSDTYSLVREYPGHQFWKCSAKHGVEGQRDVSN